ncbi:serine carboxypeptidase-like isoform X1 [Magnolia sinica]|uniref:serine carboxypeptidase-like isoform X1 n=1 Tax=Magnolia sinica TaxID=86752 RepID=UPI00265AF5F4|nr:serine carboxypeptidase-like isoform X1 [Magnolia sinica]
MKSGSSLVHLFLFFFCISVCSLSSAQTHIPLRSSKPLPSRQFAENLIRSLNLIPGIPEVESEIDPPGPRLVERKLDLEILGEIDSDVSVEELGHHAGYYRLENTHAARLFYFFFESRGSSNDPVVLWLTGGPGCSSELALFYENGPYKIADNMSLIWNDYGWDKASNLIFVDQPTGTGFSYSTDLRDIRFGEKGVSNDVYDFLQAFFKEHPSYSKNDFYITGESYAGHYIPAVAERVHRGNKEKLGLHINLKGFAIGNGLTDPAIQYQAYTDYALDMGVIKQTDHDRINKIVPVCELSIKLCGSSTLACFASFVVCNSIFSSIMLVAGDMNHYDIRKKCEGSLCYDFSNMDKFLNQKSVREALGVGKRKFVSCSPIVYEAMITDWMKNFEPGIPALIEDGIKVLVYAGEYDLICNWLGNFRWVNSMEWSGQKKFAVAPMEPFTVDGKEAGLLKSYGSLSFLKVHDAGHMVPMDQPKAALKMLKKWTRGNLSEDAYLSMATDM